MFEFTCPRIALLAIVEPAARISPARNAVPILSNVRIELDGNYLTVSGADGDRQITTSTDAVSGVKGSGATTVNAARLADTIKRGAADTVAISVTKTEMLIKCGRSRVKLPTLPAEDFPMIDAAAPVASFVLPGAELARIIGACSFAMSSEETRYFLCGIHLTVEDDKLVAVATDGHRLSLIGLDLPDGAELMPGIILPSASVAHLGKIIGTDAFTVAVAEAFATFSRPGLTLTTRLVDGNFPDYRRVIPRDNPVTVTADREALIASIARVSGFAAENADRGRDIALDISDGSLRLVAASSEGEAEDAMEVDANVRLLVGFATKVFSDVIGSFSGDAVTIAFNDASSPALVTDPSDPARLAVMMPYLLSAATMRAVEGDAGMKAAA